MAMRLTDREVCSSPEERRPRAAAAGRAPGRDAAGRADAEPPTREEEVRRGVLGVLPARRVVTTGAA